MRINRRRLAVMVSLLIPLLGLSWLLAYAYGLFEPSYDGHRISYWISLRTRTLNRGNPSATALRVLGTNGLAIPKVDSRAVPYLVKSLRLQDSRLRTWYFQQFNRLAPRWQKLLPPPVMPEIARLNASWMLGDTGPASADTIAALASCATNENGAIAMQVLMSIGVSTPEGIRGISEFASKDTNGLNRSIALGGFTRLERDPDPAIREAASKALDKMGAEHPLKDK